ncbi:hypothetical protein [Paludisphaera mucosa]|uniref:Uncharacterized protein n=1 Tax=Paludisphaera mucosa TaxID=3030827 RepID=A0ABT6F7M0_9BACT|nr:hypothetical protein [Paludisphaera mucosa]MDG3003575.1 hypothetical protein [Paludisphaera mucosa]
MSRRLNMCGFSMAKMRSLFGSGDLQAVDRVFRGLASDLGDSFAFHDEARRILETAIMKGVPFPGLETESQLHYKVASALTGDEQELLWTEASSYGADAMEVGFRRYARKHGSPETRAFVRGLVEGLPIFGQNLPEDGEVYAAIGLAKLRFFRPGLVDLRDQIAFRAGPKHEASEFAAEFCGWIDEIIDAGLDLWYATG